MLQEHKISIQMAARELRINWFYELIKEHNFSSYATAHHLDDQAETFFINLLRGTGIAGFHGILPKQGKLNSSHDVYKQELHYPIFKRRKY